MRMKKLILCGVILLSGYLPISAANYLISPQATVNGSTVNYKGVDYVVGTSAFADFSTLSGVSLETNSTVNVAPGTYSLDATFSTAGLKFLGSNAYQDWTVLRNDESVITGTIKIEASDITFNGFKFTANGRLVSQSGTNASPISNIKVIYNYVVGSTLTRTKSNPVIQIGNRIDNASAPTTAAQCRYKDCIVAHNYFGGDDSHYSNSVGLAGIFGTTKAFDNYFYYGGTSFQIDNAQGDIKIFNNVFKNVGASTASNPDGQTAGDFCVALMRSAYANSTTLYIQSNEFDGCYGQGSYFCPIRIYPGSSSATSFVDPVNLRVYINQNTFKKKTSYIPTNNNQPGENLILYADKSTTKNVRFNLSDNHYDNRFYKYAWVTLDDGLGQREIYADQFSEFILGGKMSTFGTSSLNSVEVTNHALNVSLGDVTVIQSFDIDPKTGDMYFQQVMGSRTTTYNNLYGFTNGNHEPLVVTRVPCTKIDEYAYTYSTAQKMEVGKAGHGTNMCLVRDKSGQLWIWAGGKAEDNGTGDDKSVSTARFKFAAGTDINFDGTGNTDSGVVYFDVSGKNEYPAVDETSRYLCVRTTSSSTNTYRIYDLDDALDGTKTLLKTVKLTKGDYASSEITNDAGYLTWSFQSFDINGDYIYMLEGVSQDGSNTITAGDPTIVLTTYNWRTGQWCARERLDYGRINNTYGEPEGFVIRPDEYGHVNAYVAIAVGSSGARKANVYKYIIDYHRQWDSTTAAPVTVGSDTNKSASFTSDYTAITFSTDVSQLSFSATSLTDVPSQTVTITNGTWHYGQWIGAITGPDADAFEVAVPENGPFKSSVKATVTFTPQSGKSTYNAVLRLHSPLATSNVESNDIVIPITATFKLPSNDPVISVDRSSVDFTATVGTYVTEALNILGTNLTGNINIELSGDGAEMFELSQSSLTTSGGSVSINYAPSVAGAHTATLTISSEGASDVVVALSGTATEEIIIRDDNITSLNEVWNYSQTSGNTADWITNGSQVTQDMALNDGKLYVVHRNGSNADNTIYIVDAYTGVKTGTLNTIDCTTGTYALSAIEILGDKIIACNLQTSETGALIVYMWDNDTAAPVKLLETTERPSYTKSDGSTVYRIGDAMSVSGDITNGKIWFAYGSNVFYYTVTNGVCSTTPTVLTLTKSGVAYDIAPDAATSNITVENDGSFWVSSKDYVSTHFSATGEYIESFNETTLGNKQGTDLRFIDFGTKRYAVATTYLNTSNTAISDGAFTLMNVTDGNTVASAIGKYPSLGLGGTRNTSFRTSLSYEVTRTNLNVWVLIPSQGAAYYTFQHSSPTGIDANISNPATIELSDKKVRIDGINVKQLDVYSIMGTLIMSEKTANEIDLSTLIKGVYIIAVTDEYDNITTHKVAL